MSKYLLECDTREVCTMTLFTPPPETVTLYQFAPNWVFVVAAGLVLALIIAVAVVRFRRHTEKGKTDRLRIERPLKNCPTCGDLVEAEK